MTLTADQPGLPGTPTVPEADAPGTMSLFDHITELRNRIIVCVIAVVVGSIVCWFFYNQAIDFMIHPYHHYLSQNQSKNISKGQLVTESPLEGFTTRLKVSAYGGLALAAPVLFYELWRFVTPGLRRNEKQYVLPFVGGAVVLFSMGVTVAILVFPKALDWLIGVSGHGVVPLFSPSKYFTLYVAMCLIFGLVFTYPLFVVLLEISGVVPSATWRRWRRPAIVVLVIVAALITPSSDPFSFLAMAVPMLVFYEMSILLGRILGK